MVRWSDGGCDCGTDNVLMYIWVRFEKVSEVCKSERLFISRVVQIVLGEKSRTDAPRFRSA